MYRIILLIIALVSFTACSSGNSSTDEPQDFTGRYSGTFQNNTGTQNGTVTIDVIESNPREVGGDITGNIVFNSEGSSCLISAPVTGTSNGFNLSLTAEQSGRLFRSVIVVTETVGENSRTISTTTRISRSGRTGTTVTSSGNRTTTTTVTEEELSGELNIQLAFSSSRNLSGTYVVTGNTCSAQSGNGTISVSR